jgi:D-serine dehydratase
MNLVHAIAKACVEQELFQGDEILLSAGGSAVFDLVASHLKPLLDRPVRGLLRSGCYLTHDQGNYKRMMSAVAARTGCGSGLQAAMEVWARVQSCPEPGLAILAVGKRDLSYDLEMPIPLMYRGRGHDDLRAVPADWKITGLNDQHAYLCGSSAEHAALRVGDLICLGISHPCTTFDKWRWMPLVDEAYNVCDAIVTCF